MIKKGIIVTLIFVFSTFVQLISQIVVTRLFGANLNLDIFLAAVAIPTIIVTVIYGTLNDAFMPLFSERKTKEPETADTYFFSTLLSLGFISFLVALVIGFFTNQMSWLLYSSRGEQFVKDVAVQMFYMSFSIPLSVIATLLGAYFYSHKNFNRFPFAQLIGSVTNLLLIYFLAPLMGIWALVFAFVMNIFFQIVIVIPFKSLKILMFKGSNFLTFKPFNILTLLMAWIPLIIGNFALRSDTLLIRSFGSSLPEGNLVYLNLISKIFSLATSVMTIGIQVLLLPHLVEYLTNKEYERAIRSVNKAKIIAIGISVFITILLALISPFVIRLLFIGGKFTGKDADTTISLLPLFLLPAIGWGINGVFFQPLIALKKQYQLGMIHVISLLVSWLTSLLVQQYFGALPAITSGLIVLLFGGIIGSEILWQHNKKKLIQIETVQS